MVELIDLGVREYRAVWQMQETLMSEIQLGERTSCVLTVEHPHVYTLGRNGNHANMLHLPANAELVKVNRGGDITYHGPGQLVVYTIIRLNDLGLDIRQFVHGLEEVVIRTIGVYGVAGHRIPKATGVWLDPDSSNVRKICAIGLRCSRSTTMHGFALNVNTDLSYFNHINPCGFADRGVTSLFKETGRRADLIAVKKLVIDNFAEVFGVEIV
ncbi:MAG: lipoyl(octanoyl) transferase LipB [Tannerella sp.]|jgi:lipoyl(octanoyl) transferase|nr:lipoyl(octanoyl) transferase LipB [Tannerella sp.]